MKRVAVVAMLVGCGPKSVAEPAEPTAPAPAAPSRCVPTTDLVPMKAFSDNMPDGYNELEITSALAQALVTSGLTIDSKDDVAHTIVTAEFVGQTLLSSCSINEYRAYSLRIVVTGKTVFITMGCRESMGWESYVWGGYVYPANRGGAMITCDPFTHGYISKLDSTIPKMIVEGARDALYLHRRP